MQLQQVFDDDPRIVQDGATLRQGHILQLLDQAFEVDLVEPSCAQQIQLC